MPRVKSNRKDQRREVQASWVIYSYPQQSREDAMPYLEAVAIMEANSRIARANALRQGV